MVELNPQGNESQHKNLTSDGGSLSLYQALMF